MGKKERLGKGNKQKSNEDDSSVEQASTRTTDHTYSDSDSAGTYETAGNSSDASISSTEEREDSGAGNSDSDNDVPARRASERIKARASNGSTGTSSKSSAPQEREDLGPGNSDSGNDVPALRASERIKARASNGSTGTSSKSPTATTQERKAPKRKTLHGDSDSEDDGSVQRASKRIKTQTKTNPSESAGTSSNSTEGTSSAAPPADSTAEESENCPVCLANFNTQETATISSCNHLFCLDCITAWSKKTNTCPVDRRVFTQIQVRRSINDRSIRVIPVASRQQGPPVMHYHDMCHICNGYEDQEDIVRCTGCGRFYHQGCLLLLNFSCPRCTANNAREGPGHP